MTENLHLAVALEGAGWHPAAWREQSARPSELLDATYWVDVVRQAERGLLDLVTIEDAFRLQERGPRGRLDATLIAARVAPVTEHIGLVPTAIVTHTEPFHLAKLIATIDFATTDGRAGVRVQVSARPDEAAHFGRREAPRLADAIEEAADYVEVLRRLWDSWEDDAEIRDVTTGRFVDRDRLHYIDFEGRFFSVRGPSITPRPPQGQPIVAALGHQSVPYALIGTSADVGFVTPHDTTRARDIVTEIRGHQAGAGRADETVHVFGDLVVFLDDTAPAAAARRARLDDLAGAEYRSDALIFAGTPAQLADLLIDWQGAGLTGYRLRPATIPHDLTQITDALVPELQRRGAFRTAYESTSLRGLLGLPRPANRYATVGES